MDVAESLAIARAKELFGADHANVQPHSGAQANMAVYMAVLQPGDTMLGMGLAHGGHLTHGYQINFSGKLYHARAYGVDSETERLDYDALAQQTLRRAPQDARGGRQRLPAHLRLPALPPDRRRVGAMLLVDMAHIAGLVAAGVHPSPDALTPISSPPPRTRRCAARAAA